MTAIRLAVLALLLLSTIGLALWLAWPSPKEIDRG